MAIPAYYSLLHRGSSGPDVALVQTWLNGVRDACTWHDPLKADGKFGLSTENAVKEFQLKNKMNVDGKLQKGQWISRRVSAADCLRESDSLRDTSGESLRGAFAFLILRHRPVPAPFPP